MKINVVRRKMIKPCTPTPQNLKKYKISFRDELSPPSNVGVVLFYQSKPKLTIGLLEESLSRILPQFYPLAGRYINQDYAVDCSDQGVEFIEAQLDTTSLATCELDDLLPRRSDQFAGANDPLLSIQITELIKSGRLAIAVSVSHRIFDASSIRTFITAWSNANKNPGGEITIVPNFDPHLMFPGKKRSYFSETKPSGTTVVSKRFLFKMESIMNLRSKLWPIAGRNNALSKVRVVSALITKALIRIDQMKYGYDRPCLIIQAVDMRHRTIPPFPQHSCGNLTLHSVAKCTQGASDLGIQELTRMISDAIEKTVSDCAKLFSAGEDGHEDIIINPEADLVEGFKSCDVHDLWFSDWSKMELYEADFGWGKPVSVGMALVPYERITMLMNNKDGDGIEAWVHLSPNDMQTFVEDEDIQFFSA